MRYLLAVCVIVSVVSAPTQTCAQDRNREEPAAAIPIDLKDPDQVLEYTSKLQIEYEKALHIANTAVRDREKEKADRSINALLGKVVRVHTKIKLLPKPYGVRSTGLSRRLPVKISDELYVLTGVAFDIYNFAGDRTEGRPILSVPRADISLEDFEKLTGEEEGVCEGKIISFEPTARGEYRYRTFVIEGRFVTGPNGKPVKRQNVIPPRGRWRGTLVYDDGEARNASLEFAGGEHTYHEQDQEFYKITIKGFFKTYGERVSVSLEGVAGKGERVSGEFTGNLSDGYLIEGTFVKDRVMITEKQVGPELFQVVSQRLEKSHKGTFRLLYCPDPPLPSAPFRLPDPPR